MGLLVSGDGVRYRVLKCAFCLLIELVVPYNLSVSHREVFQCSVLICFWRVRHAWHKNLMKRCSEMEMRAGIAKKLGQAVHKICTGVGSLETFEDIMEDIIDVGDFVEYFKAVWVPRLGLWIKTLKNLPLASQESSAAMEFYHNQMRLRLMNEKDLNVYQRTDWLVDKLGTKVHSYFWLDEYSGKDDFARYRKDEWLSGLTAWRKSLKIPDINVVMEGECVKVVDQEDQDAVHVIWNPGSEFSICDCNWASKGNLCEHVIKTIKFFRQKGYIVPSVSMFQYHQALVNMLHCPPYDSLIRDHAVSLAVWVETLLNSQIGQDNSMFMSNPEKEQSIGSYNGDVANEYHYRNGNISSQLENGFASQIKACPANSERSALSNRITTESHTCNEVGAGQTCVEMQIDPSSISNSITQSLSVNENVFTDSLAQNRDVVLIDVDQDPMKNLPSAHADFENKSGGEDIFGDNGSETIRDTEMKSIDVPSSGTCGEYGSIISNDGLSPSVSKVIDSQLVNMVLSSDVVGENGRLSQEESATKENVGDTSLTPSMDSPVDIIN